MSKTFNPLVESPEKQRLEQEIAEKIKLLASLVEQVESLKIDLSGVKQEYQAKVGRLYLRLDELDLEILKLKKIGDLMEKGLPYEKAKELVEKQLNDKFQHIRQEYENLQQEEEQFESKRTISQEEREELTRLYRKLALKFHPDVAGGSEEMMKKINQAYKDGDLETLRLLDRSESPAREKAETIEELKAKLTKLDKTVEKLRSEYRELMESEWFLMKENVELAKTQGRDFFRELSEKIKSDIAKKEEKLKELKGLYE